MAKKIGLRKPAEQPLRDNPVMNGAQGAEDATPVQPGQMPTGPDDESLEEDGTLASGYAEDGPYHCQDCMHVIQDESCCTHPVVVNDPALAARKNEEGKIAINLERGCCRFVRPPEEKQGPMSDEEPI